MRINGNGFTLLEMMVVVMIMGVLTALAVPSYIKTTENARALEAAGTGSILSVAVRNFVADNPGANFEESTLTDACNNNGACNTANPQACTLVRCNYIPKQDWSGKSYNFTIAGRVVWVGRKGGSAPGTNSSPYNVWGYSFDGEGNCARYNGAPICPSL